MGLWGTCVNHSRCLGQKPHLNCLKLAEELIDKKIEHGVELKAEAQSISPILGQFGVTFSQALPCDDRETACFSIKRRSHPLRLNISPRIKVHGIDLDYMPSLVTCPSWESASAVILTMV